MSARGTVRAVLLVATGVGIAGGSVGASGASSGQATETPEATLGAMDNSVVKVLSTVVYPDAYKPWTKQAPTELTGSGVVIEGKRILTNAHLVLYASQVQVQANRSSERVPARVEAVADGVDLAVLKLDDEALFDSHRPVARVSSLPLVKDPVVAYGYPIGGQSLSVTKGIVSRIEFTGAPFPTLVTGSLQIQIDAAINPGNSGGPAMVEDKMIGLAFSYFAGAQNIGYIIPNEEVELFLEDVADGRYDGKPGMADELQTLENPALRSFLKLPKSAAGMVVHRVASSDPRYPLRKWDLITRIGDTPIDNQGMISAGENLRVRFRYLIQRLARNGKVPLTILREGREMPVDLPVAPRRPMLVPDLQGAYPSYFVYGPLVFSVATQQFLSGYFQGAARDPMSALNIMTSPLMRRFLEGPAFEGEAFVVVSSPLFPHRLSRGYSDPVGSVVESVNGTRVKSLVHLVELLRDSRDEFTAIDFQQRNGETLVFSRVEMLDATDEILSSNGIRSQGSPDVLKIWNARPTR